MTISPGAWTIFHGDVTASFSGMPEGRQKLLGSSFPAVSMRCLYTSAAQGWKGTSFRSAAMLIRYFRPGTSQTPPKSGVPSGNRGALAERSALPSFVRGTPALGTFSHCAETGMHVQSWTANAIRLQRDSLSNEIVSDGDYTPYNCR